MFLLDFFYQNGCTFINCCNLPRNCLNSSDFGWVAYILSHHFFQERMIYFSVKVNVLNNGFDF